MQSRTVCRRAGAGGDEGGSGNFRTFDRAECGARFSAGRNGLEDCHIARGDLGARSVRGNERLHGAGDAGIAEEDYSDWVVHYHNRGSAEGTGEGVESPEPDDLRLETLSLLLPVDAGWTNAVWR